MGSDRGPRQSGDQQHDRLQRRRRRSGQRGHRKLDQKQLALRQRRPRDHLVPNRRRARPDAQRRRRLRLGPEPAPELPGRHQGRGGRRLHELRGHASEHPEHDLLDRRVPLDRLRPVGLRRRHDSIADPSATTDSTGHASFAGTFNSEVPVGTQITATATDPQSNTSELSQCFSATRQSGLPPDLTFTVNSEADTDDGFCTVSNCTLREAIERSNARPGTDTITFAVPGNSYPTIRPTSALPTITDGVVISAQSSCQWQYRVVIDGSLAGDADGLTIANSTGRRARSCAAS